jgi:hypothetical protein
VLVGIRRNTLGQNRGRTDIEHNERDCSDSCFQVPDNLAIRLVALDRVGVFERSGNFIASSTGRDVFDLGDISLIIIALLEIRIHAVDFLGAYESEFETSKEVVAYTLSPLLNRSLMIPNYGQCRPGIPRLGVYITTRFYRVNQKSNLLIGFHIQNSSPNVEKPPTDTR